MNCLKCGACCESITLAVQMDNEDLQRFLELRTKPVWNRTSFHRNFDVPCSAFIEGRCGIYPHRPQVCRDFTPGGEGCLATIRARRTRDQFYLVRELDDASYTAGGSTSLIKIKDGDHYKEICAGDFRVGDEMWVEPVVEPVVDPYLTGTTRHKVILPKKRTRK